MVDKKKIDEMIDYFKTEKENARHFFFILREKDKLGQNTILTFCTIFIAIAVGLITYGLFILGGILCEFALATAYFGYSRYSKRQDKNGLDYIDRKCRLESIIEALQILKIADYEVSLDSLIEKIKNYSTEWVEKRPYFKSVEKLENNLLDEFFSEITKIEIEAKRRKVK